MKAMEVEKAEGMVISGIHEIEALVTAQLHREDRSGACIVQIHNQAPPAWNVLICGGGCRFYYQNPDGSPDGEFKDIVANVQIGFGGTLVLRSDRPERCVKGWELVVFVSVQGQAPQPFGATESTDASHCLLGEQYTLGSEKVIPRQKFEAGKVAEFLRLCPRS